MARILAVDDEPEVRDILSRFFSGKGYDVLTAESGEAALAMLDKENVDAVLLDIRMPGLSGVETLRRIKSQWPGIAVVMVSAEDDEEVAKESLREGAFDYVVKPIQFDHLEATLYFKMIQEEIL